MDTGAVLERSHAQQVVLLLDCCYGGAFARGVVARSGGGVDVRDRFVPPAGLGEGRGRVVITASTAMEYAFEGAQLASGAGRAGPSVFTGALVGGIRTGDADRDGDGAVSLSELYDYVYDRVREVSPRQTPSKWEFGVHGSLLIARNPHRRIMPDPLPPEVLDLVEHSTSAGRLAAVGELARLAAGANRNRGAAARNALTRLVDDDSRGAGAGRRHGAAVPAGHRPRPGAARQPAAGRRCRGRRRPTGPGLHRLGIRQWRIRRRAAGQARRRRPAHHLDARPAGPPRRGRHPHRTGRPGVLGVRVRGRRPRQLC